MIHVKTQFQMLSFRGQWNGQYSAVALLSSLSDASLCSNATMSWLEQSAERRSCCNCNLLDDVQRTQPSSAHSTPRCCCCWQTAVYIGRRRGCCVYTPYTCWPVLLLVVVVINAVSEHRWPVTDVHSTVRLMNLARWRVSLVASLCNTSSQ